MPPSHRPFALEIARLLLRPKGLEVLFRSGLFLARSPCCGKTTFLSSDLIPALRKFGATVIHIELRADDVHVGLSTQLMTEACQTLCCGGHVDAHGPARAARAEFATLTEAFAHCIDVCRTDLVVIIDGIQLAGAFADGHATMLALKAARDAINLRSRTPGYFLFLGTGVDSATLRRMTVDSDQGFYGASVLDFPSLR